MADRRVRHPPAHRPARREAVAARRRLRAVRLRRARRVAIYFSRSVVRFVYERAFKLTTQYKFWPGGGFLCLGSAYLGATLGTVGFELEAANSPDDSERIVRMKAWLIAVALGGLPWTSVWGYAGSMFAATSQPVWSKIS